VRRINGSDNFSEPIWLIEVDGYRMPNVICVISKIEYGIIWSWGRDISSCVKINNKR
jgi:hypothetical protein